MDNLIKNWEKNAVKNEERNYLFLRSLKHKDEENVDSIAKDLHEEAFNRVNCLDCGNCCKKLKPLLTNEEIPRIAQYLNQSEAEFTAKYLAETEYNDWEIAKQPCPFLDSKNKCKIYEVRPNVCREYPNTNKNNFASRSYAHTDNTIICPATFFIVEKMRTMANLI